MKDLFSDKSNEYAQFRPDYPEDLINYISGLCINHQNAWDCATGNGQLAKKLIRNFEKVYATDISAQQLENAEQIPGIIYSNQPAEKTDFGNSFFDLIVVAQAVHWFNFPSFFSEAKRTLKHDAWIILLGYGLLKIDTKIDHFIYDFYRNKIGSYWDAERKYIDDEYKTIDFPFQEIKTPTFEIKCNWTYDRLAGYLQTWSAVKNYNKKNSEVALGADFLKSLKDLWDDKAIREVRFPLFMRAGKNQ